MDTSQPALAASPLPFLHLIQRLKHLPRTGWLRTVENPESVASHSFRLALLGAFAPAPLDRSKCMFIGICHDLAESVVGDIPTYANVPKKNQRESNAFRYIEELVKPCNPALATEVLAAWKEYEYGESPEGRWMKEMDKLECLIQAQEYEQSTFGEKDLEEFQGLKAKIQSPEALQWLHLLDKERSTCSLKRQRKLSIIFLYGDPNKMHSKRLCEEFGLTLISVGEILHKASQDPRYPHATSLKAGLEHNLDIPADLTINLLALNLESVREGDCAVISDLPREHLSEFEKQLHRTNLVLHINDGTPLIGQGCSNLASCIKEIHRDSFDEVYSELRLAVKEFREKK